MWKIQAGDGVNYETSNYRKSGPSPVRQRKRYHICMAYREMASREWGVNVPIRFLAFLSVQANPTNTRSKGQSNKAVSKIMGGVAVVWCKVTEREKKSLYCCILVPFLSFPLDAGGK